MAGSRPPAGQGWAGLLGCAFLPRQLAVALERRLLGPPPLAAQATRSSAQRRSTWCTTEAAAACQPAGHCRPPHLSARQLSRSGMRTSMSRRAAAHSTPTLAAAPLLLRPPCTILCNISLSQAWRANGVGQHGVGPLSHSVGGTAGPPRPPHRFAASRIPAATTSPLRIHTRTESLLAIPTSPHQPPPGPSPPHTMAFYGSFGLAASDRLSQAFEAAGEPMQGTSGLPPKTCWPPPPTAALPPSPCPQACVSRPPSPSNPACRASSPTSSTAFTCGARSDSGRRRRRPPAPPPAPPPMRPSCSGASRLPPRCSAGPRSAPTRPGRRAAWTTPRPTPPRSSRA